MSANYSSHHQQLIAAILAASDQPLTPVTREFIACFYAMEPLEDLTALDPVHGAQLALAAYADFMHCVPEAPYINIRLEKITEHGRSVTRTVVTAINPDQPFLVDSLSALFTALGMRIHRLHHPIFDAARNPQGTLERFAQAGHDGHHTARESLIYAELSALPATLDAAMLEQKMRHTLTHIAAAVDDWQPMRDAVDALANDFKTTAIHSSEEAMQRETHDLLHWLADNHFVFLGTAEFDLAGDGKSVQCNPASARGIYRLEGAADAIEYGSNPTAASEGIVVLKASGISEVHRRANMDYIALRRTDARGQYRGEFRILGLFTSTVYWRETGAIPFLRHKTAGVLLRAGFDPQSHSGKSLKTTLEFMPRDELFQMDDDALFAMAMGILSLEARPQVRLFVRTDPFKRFISAMVYVPRERFSTHLREEIVKLLTRSYQGQFVTFYTQVSDSPLARVTIVINTQESDSATVDERAAEAAIAALANNWAESLREAILTHPDISEGEALAQSFAAAFPIAYVNTHSATEAAQDVADMLLCQRTGIALRLTRHESASTADQLQLKCFTRDTEAELSSIIPLLEHMGAVVIDAAPHLITPLAPMEPALLRIFTLRTGMAATLDMQQDAPRITQAIAAAWQGDSDNDTLNALVIAAGLTARDVTVLRAYSRYLQQLDFPYSQPFIAAALSAHPALTALLVQLFHARFDPSITHRDAACSTLQQQLETGLEQVTKLAEDRIIRRFLALIQASLRTNFYQTQADGSAKPYLSIKFRSSLIPDMPLPVPYAEIFVTSMRVEGIHLRGGAVARGGLRWSDRPEDFRSEVLGLVKAQMVKNAVIVPQGAKGGFILRKPPGERAALMDEGVECYRMFLRGLLDITDNLVNNSVVPPAHTVRHDGDDPYLVVAADKGTATFSDYANALAAEYGFWLGDAFASGGSVGYDHKAMGITARGAWVSVERHFREMGRDCATEDFTCVGIGDMSGDVFGNGMLLSPHTRLIAAFNHRHIFLDPAPDAATSFAERARLFALPRSGWNDYNTNLISMGGGVFERSEKTIRLSPEIRAALGTEVASATPDELIRIILTAPVDLLWNGGIGTYVKAASETNEQVGDRANASVRVNGGELRCKVVGEGGNLGLTQRGRIEYARLGGRINTDAIDNSGGVDCSDHEVNIKIAFGTVVETGAITLEQRNVVLKEMTDEVADLVLIDNRLQTQAISIAHAQGAGLLDAAEQLIQQLEAEHFLNRAVEFLPDARQFAELRASKLGLTRPELAVLMAYAKMALSRDLKESTALDAPYFTHDLLRYFPKAMQQRFGEAIESHRLKREIVATMITNSIVNRTGFTFAHGLMRATGLGAAPLAIAYIATRDAFDLRTLWKGIEALDARVSPALVATLFSRINDFIEHSCRWFLTHQPQPVAIDMLMARYAASVATIIGHAEDLMTETLRKSYNKTVAEWVAEAVPETLAKRIAQLETLGSACDIIDIADLLRRPLEEVGRTYFELGAQLKLGWLRRTARSLATDTAWQSQAVQSLVGNFYQAQRQLTLDVLAQDPDTHAAAHWAQAHQESLRRFGDFIQHLRAQPNADAAMLIVALQQVQQVMLARSEQAA